MLVVEKLAAAYGPAQVLFDVTFAVGAGEVVTLLGRNGMGKTTTIRTLMGLVPARGGAATFDGRALIGLRRPIHRAGRARPRARGPADLSDADGRGKPGRHRGGAVRRAAMDAATVYALFPKLAERRRNLGSQLSGGEQQMLAIGRALMTNPKLLILDEATEGLAPLIRAEIWSCLARLKTEGQAILLVDKHLEALTRIADRHVVIEKGHSVWTGTSAALLADPTVRQRYLQI